MSASAPEITHQQANEVRAGAARWTALAVVITALGAALRFYHLGARSFWFDEALSIAYARLPATQFLKLPWAPWVNVNMALYYALLRSWLHLGSGETAVRALSAIFGAATVPFIYLIGRRIYGSATGALAALLLALNAFDIRYSQEARAYALEMLLVTAATFLLLEAVRRRTRSAWTLYAICAAAAVYAHVLAGLLVVAHGLWLLGRKDDVDWRHARHALDVFVALIFPALVCAWHAGTASVNWIPPTSVARVRQFFVLITGNGVILWEMIALLWLAGLAAVVMRRAPRDAVLIWAWLAAPVAAAGAVSLAHPIFEPRYLALCAPAAALATAAGVRELRRKPLIAAATLAVVTLTAMQSPSAYVDPMGSVVQNYRAATEYVLRSAQPGDAIFFHPGPGRAGYEIYRRGRPGPEVIYPAHRQALLDYLPQPLAEFLPDVPMDRPRVFLFITELPTRGPDIGQDAARAWLRRHYRVAAEAQFEGVDVVTYTK